MEAGTGVGTGTADAVDVTLMEPSMGSGEAVRVDGRGDVGGRPKCGTGAAPGAGAPR
ncbi:hypothetical protein GCM10012285_58230 [Streptomyces kronopolitis]|uniref:Uncharacterized protein n=1 Tax=Streptomyces kronopolitis TaxID=1612435 RepID=A0ABQ2JZ49_9ACTN|nr:hypothetical protein GCM10012285_58230 [Streptomyces kronopolitis]